MAGVNFDGLPKNLQAKLNEFKFVARSVEDAIEMAKAKGTWTTADDKVMSELNGGANWGKTMDEVDLSKPGAFKQYAKAKPPKTKSDTKTIALNLGNTGKSNAQRRAELEKQIAEYKAEGAIGWLKAIPAAIEYNMIPEKDGVQQAGFGPGAVVVATLLAAGTIMSCSKSDSITEYNFENNNNNTVNVTVKQDLAALENLINKLIQITQQNGTDNGQKLEELLKEVQRLRTDVNANSAQTHFLLSQLLDVAATNMNMLSHIIDGLSKNNDLLQVIIDKMNDLAKQAGFGTQVLAKLDAILAEIKNNGQINADGFSKIVKLLAQLDANNDKRNEKILEAIKKLGIDVTSNLTKIYTIINQHKDKDYSAILDKILDAILKGNNDNNTNYQNAIAMLAKIDADILKVLDVINKLGDNVTNTLINIYAEISKKPQNEQKDYTDILNKILDEIKNGNAQNNKNFERVLAAIEKLGVSVTGGLNIILEALKKGMTDYSAKLDAILDRLDKLGDKAQKILEAIKDHDVKITVDVTGKVSCECNCNCGNQGGVHEGILGDLNDLLG